MGRVVLNETITKSFRNQNKYDRRNKNVIEEDSEEEYAEVAEESNDEVSLSEEDESDSEMNEEGEDEDEDIEEDGDEDGEEDGDEDGEEDDEDDNEEEGEGNSQEDSDDEAPVEAPTKKSSFKEKQSEQINNLKQTIQSELNQMTFEEIKKLQNKIGLKKFNEIVKQNSSPEASIKTFGRLNKNRPQELSSKKPVSTLRTIIPVKKQEAIDPRFSSAFGEYKPDYFRKTYSFIHDMRLKEKEELGKQLKEEKDSQRKEDIKSAMTRLKQQIKSFDESEKKQQFDQNIKKKVMQDAKEGKRPQFINKSEKKLLELAEKYKELKKSGKVEKFLAKKRKKQLGKDSKHLNKNEHIHYV